MKKMLKSLFCVLLSVMIVFSVVPVFATEHGDSFEWNDTSFYCVGEAKLGDNSIKVDDKDVYVDFSFEQDGYYYITLESYQSNYYVRDISVPLKYDENTCGEKDSFFNCSAILDNEFMQYIFRLENGNEKLFFNLFSNDTFIIEGSRLDFNIEYLGKEITGIRFEDDDTKFLMIENIDENTDATGGYDYYYNLCCDFTVFFDEQEKLEFEEMELTLGMQEPIACGKNEVAKIFYDYEEIDTITVGFVSDYIKSVKFIGEEAYFYKVYYDDYVEGGFNSEQRSDIEVTYKNSLKKVFAYPCLTLAWNSSREYFWNIKYIQNSNDVFAQVWIASELFTQFPCTKIYASYEENAERFKGKYEYNVALFRENISMTWDSVKYAQTFSEKLKKLPETTVSALKKNVTFLIILAKESTALMAASIFAFVQKA